MLPAQDQPSRPKNLQPSDQRVAKSYSDADPQVTNMWAPARPVLKDAPFSTPPRTFWITLLGTNATISGQTLQWFVADPSIGLLRPHTTVTLVSVYATNQTTGPLEFGLSGLATNNWSTSDRQYFLRTFAVPTGSLYVPPPPVTAETTLQDRDFLSSGRRITLTQITSGNAFTSNDTYRVVLKVQEY